MDIKQKKPLITDLSKIPPHSKELEEIILGTLILCKNKHTDYVFNFLHDSDFYYENNSIIFKLLKNGTMSL